jgi:hypothetical protein
MAGLGTVGQSVRAGVAAGSVVVPAALGGLTGGVPQGAVGRSAGLYRAVPGKCPPVRRPLGYLQRARRATFT